jgi:hypothetical protein
MYVCMYILRGSAEKVLIPLRLTGEKSAKPRNKGNTFQGLLRAVSHQHNIHWSVGGLHGWSLRSRFATRNGIPVVLQPEI